MNHNPITRRTTFAALILSAVFTLPSWVHAAPVPADASKQELESLWADLIKTAKDEGDASRALLKLSKHRDVVPFLKGKLKPLQISPERVRVVLKDLGSDDEKVWTAAVEEFEYFDPRLAIDLEPLMKEVTESPARQRLVVVLSRSSGQKPAEYAKLFADMAGKDVQFNKFAGGFNFFVQAQGSWWAENKVARLNETAWGNCRSYWTRAVRGISLLEHLGTPDAIAIIKDLTTGHPDAQPTRAAKEAMKRIEAK